MRSKQTTGSLISKTADLKINDIINVGDLIPNISPNSANRELFGKNFYYMFELPEMLKLIPNNDSTFKNYVDVYNSNSLRTIDTDEMPNFSKLKTSLHNIVSGIQPLISKTSLLELFYIIEVNETDINSNSYNILTFNPLLFINGKKVASSHVGILRSLRNNKTYLLLDKNDLYIKNNFVSNIDKSINILLEYKLFTTLDTYKKSQCGKGIKMVLPETITDDSTYNVYGELQNEPGYTDVQGYNFEPAISDLKNSNIFNINKQILNDYIDFYLYENSTNTYHQLSSQYYNLLYIAYNDIDTLENNTDFYIQNKLSSTYSKRYIELLNLSFDSETQIKKQLFTINNYIWLAKHLLNSLYYIDRRKMPSYINANNINANTILTETNGITIPYIFRETDVLIFNIETGTVLIPGTDYTFIPLNSNNNNYIYNIKFLKSYKSIELIFKPNIEYTIFISTPTSNEGINSCMKKAKLYGYNIDLSKHKPLLFDNSDCYLASYENAKLARIEIGRNYFIKDNIEDISSSDSLLLIDIDQALPFIGTRYVNYSDPTIIARNNKIYNDDEIYDDDNISGSILHSALTPNEYNESNGSAYYEENEIVIYNNIPVAMCKNSDNIVGITNKNNIDESIINNKTSYSNINNSLTTCTNEIVTLFNDINTSIYSETLYNNISRLILSIGTDDINENYIISKSNSDYLLYLPYESISLESQEFSKDSNNNPVTTKTIDYITYQNYIGGNDNPDSNYNNSITNTLIYKTGTNTNLSLANIDDVYTAVYPSNTVNRENISISYTPILNLPKFDIDLNWTDIFDIDGTKIQKNANILTGQITDKIKLNKEYIIDNCKKISDFNYIISHKPGSTMAYVFKHNNNDDDAYLYVQLAGAVPFRVKPFRYRNGKDVYDIYLAPDNPLLIYYYINANVLAKCFS